MASGALARIPPVATTGVGSLPLAPGEAARHAARAYDVPFCPQLPRIDGDMIEEWLGADPGRCGWSPDRDRERPAAWDDFVAELRASPPEHGWVKLQVTGPVTLATALEREAGRVGSGAEVAALAREVASWLAAAVGERLERIGRLGLDAMLFVDEPGLAQAGLSEADVDAWDPLRARAAGAFGVHVCGAVPWALIADLAPDLISFDLVRHGLAPDARGPLSRQVLNGGRIVWGGLDPIRPDGEAATATRMAAAIGSLGAGLDAERVKAQSLLSASCGSGRLSAAREHEIAVTLRTASRRVADGDARRLQPGAAAGAESG